MTPVVQTPTPETAKIQDLRLMTAIKTPFTSTGKIDLTAFDLHVEHQLANGVEALVTLITLNNPT